MRVLNTSEDNCNENAVGSNSNSGDAFHSLTDDESDDLYQNDLLDW